MGDEPLRQLLQRCTVRLNVGGEYGNQGTGFFVAPGLILTCAHVIEVEGKESSVVKVFWREESQKQYEAKVEQVFNAPDIDLALLKLTTDPPPHPCVRLKQDDPQLHDQLYIFGCNYSGLKEKVDFWPCAER
jgi:Trypsin-like peptidase domain